MPRGFVGGNDADDLFGAPDPVGMIDATLILCRAVAE